MLWATVLNIVKRQTSIAIWQAWHKEKEPKKRNEAETHETLLKEQAFFATRAITT
jgi:hypothetical protein